MKEPINKCDQRWGLRCEMQSQGCKALLGALITEPPPPQCALRTGWGVPGVGPGWGADRPDPGHLHFLPLRLALVLPPPPARPPFPEQGLETPFCGDRNTSQGPRSEKEVDCKPWDRVEKARALPLSPAGPLEARSPGGHPFSGFLCASYKPQSCQPRPRWTPRPHVQPLLRTPLPLKNDF